MDLSGATLRAGPLTYAVESGEIRSMDPATGEVRGQFTLKDGAKLRRGHAGLVIEARHEFEVRLLASAIDRNGERHYRFVASCDPQIAALIDLMLHPMRHPTLLESAMR